MYRQQDRIDSLGQFLGNAIAVGGAFAMVMIVGWQLVQFLMYGAWPAFSALDLLLMAFPQSMWLVAPDSWVGLHSVLGGIHGGLFLCLAALPVGFGIVALVSITDNTPATSIR